jgi:hypothetical protein
MARSGSGGAPAVVDGAPAPWSELPWPEWEPTILTVHMWTQVAGKIRMALAPPRNHWWHVTLYVTSRGLTTSPIPYGDRDFQIDFDFIGHRLSVTDSVGGTFAMALEPMSVARFHRHLIDGLASLGIEVRISTRPVEVVDAIPFESVEVHVSYDRDHVRALFGALLDADRVMQTFQAEFIGKVSPVHFFWGSFDLATTRFSGRSAPLHPGGAPNCPDWVMQEAYSREESSVGFWPTSTAPGPIFYAYTYPEPPGYRAATLPSKAAFFDRRFGEFVLAHDDVRAAADPDAMVLGFLRSTYELGADLGGWDRAALEPVAAPGRPPRRPWTIASGRPGGDRG